MTQCRAQRALNRIVVALRRIDADLAGGGRPEAGAASIAQLRGFRQQLKAMKRELEAASPTGRFVGLGRTVTDSWPFDDSLADVLLDAEQAYWEASR